MQGTQTTAAWLGTAACLSLGVGLGMGIYVLASCSPVARPRFGYRGVERRRALRANRRFRWIEPVMRVVAGWIVALERRDPWLDTLTLRIRQAGDPMGLSAHELVALVVLGAMGAGTAGAWIGWGTEQTVAWVVSGSAVGGVMPWLQLDAVRRRRVRAIQKGLPGAIDLAALCMGAGLDFPGALRCIVQGQADRTDPLRQELKRILQQLELGHTRRFALTCFAEGVPCDAVRNFVSATLQAEEKGMPLAETLKAQARVLRMRRSVAAEEAAAKAGVLLIMPLMLLLCCILILLLGPHLAGGVGM